MSSGSLSGLLVEQGLPEHATLLDRLYQLYLHDLSPYCDLDVGDQGRLDDGVHPATYLGGRKDRIAYVARCRPSERGDKHVPCGFVLLDRDAEFDPDTFTGWRVAEMAILRRYRGRGFGKAMLASVCARHSGTFQAAVLGRNKSAMEFWRRVLREMSPASVHEHYDAEDDELLMSWTWPEKA
jgi:predicted acetyltransferase